MMKYFLFFSFIFICQGGRAEESRAGGQDGRMIQNSWQNIRENLVIRYFSPTKYSAGGSASEIWDGMGDPITCNIDEDINVQLDLPASFVNDKQMKVYTHGFSASVIRGDETQFVDAWMQTRDLNLSVVLVDWSPLATALQFEDWGSYIYDSAARSAIDVGEYLGHCLAEITRVGNMEADSFHLLGHSLGAHMMGKAARVYTELTGEKVARISGLDPAGPRFIDGPVMGYIPELHRDRLTPDSARFVDVIHTDDSFTPAALWITPRLGDLNTLGHVDFYPMGGEEQSGCQLGGPDALPFSVCSHNRASLFYIHSIWEDQLFPSMECKDASSCNQDKTISSEVTSFMGERSQEFYTGEKKNFYLEIQDQHWDYYTHY